MYDAIFNRPRDICIDFSAQCKDIQVTYHYSENGFVKLAKAMLEAGHEDGPIHFKEIGVKAGFETHYEFPSLVKLAEYTREEPVTVEQPDGRGAHLRSTLADKVRVLDPAATMAGQLSGVTPSVYNRLINLRDDGVTIDDLHLRSRTAIAPFVADAAAHIAKFEDAMKSTAKISPTTAIDVAGERVVISAKQQDAFARMADQVGSVGLDTVIRSLHGKTRNTMSDAGWIAEVARDNKPSITVWVVTDKGFAVMKAIGLSAKMIA